MSQDLSSLANDSMWVTSQAGGNRMSSPEKAMTAPGSSPVDPELPHVQQADPHVDIPAQPMAPGTNGKPKASQQHWSPPGPPKWTSASPPNVVREK